MIDKAPQTATSQELGKSFVNVQRIGNYCVIESTINSRPLTYVSEDVTDLAPIKPDMFLLHLQGSGLADCDAVDSGSLN